MIRMKAKSVFLSIMLLLASFVFFACKEQTEINVESISFTEQSISLLVGEEYEPDIKVLPSYATVRSYTLISNDVTALKVDGATITALKPAMDIKLKVVSDENVNVNDVISVNIYSEATELDVPTELKFDGERFTFVGKDNANAYALQINGTEINIGNNTEYNFSDIIGKVSNLYDQVVTCKVKAVGDGKVFNDSDYSETISFIKVTSVSNAYVENEKLYFDAIKNVASYTVDVLPSGQKYIVNNPSFNATQLSLDISQLTNSVEGAQYVIKITPNIEGYNTSSEIGVFGGVTTQMDYFVLGQVKNLMIVENVISWGFVNHAQTYTVAVYKDGHFVKEFAQIANNELEIDINEAGEYYYQVIANSTSTNTTAGKQYSEPLYFEILEAPVISLNNNIVSWTDTDGAEGYLVTIKNDVGANIVSQKFVLDNKYNISNFGAGTYYIEVKACGNGENGLTAKAILSSKTSLQASWIILNNLQLQIKDEKLYWKDLDNNSLNKYRVTFGDVDITLTSQDYGTQYSYDQASNTFVYDLSGYNFEPNTYNITVQSIGEGPIFDAVANELDVIKLEDSTISLSDNQFSITPVVNASEYKIGIYKAGDLDNAVLMLDNMSGYKFDFDTSLIEDGNYVAKIFICGNGTNIFDASNSSDTTTLTFKKLAIPTIGIDKNNLKVLVDQEDLVKDETSYKLFENGADIKEKFVDNQYDLQELSAGDYVYTAQAIGDGATILDSDVTVVANAKTVKKLSNPTINFVKEELKFEINCGDDEQFVNYYTMTLNDNPITVANNVAHCSEEDVKVAGNYEVEVYANPNESAGYSLIIASATQNYSFSKLNGLCDFAISNGMLIVTPTTNLTESGYSLSVRIDNGENDIILEGFDYSGSQFSIRLQDLEYNEIEAISSIMQIAGEYSVYATISQNKENVVTSNETVCANTLKVLGKVTTIAKNEQGGVQGIEFNSVGNATNYIAVLELDGAEYYIDIAQTGNVLTMEKLLTLMDDVGVSYLEQTAYNISFVAVSNDVYTLANKGSVKYNFEFLKTPIISIIEQSNNLKYLSIINEDVNASNYYVAVSQNDAIIGDASPTKSAEGSTIVDIDELTKNVTTGLPMLVAGNVKIQVKASTSNANYFNSKNGELNVVKLDTSAITITDGLLNWNKIDNAKQYNLVYSNLGGTETLVLTEDSENFTIYEDKCVYNFDTLIAGTTSIYLQVDANLQNGDTYYLNSNNSDTFDIYKMEKPAISVLNGRIYMEMRNADLQFAGKVDLKVDDESGIEVIVEGLNVKVISNGIDLVELDDGSVELNLMADRLGVSVDPKVLCKYGETELLKETLTIKVYSNDSKTLNSSTNTKEIYGLLSPTNLDISTSITKTESDAIDEVFEKIKWNNPSANASRVIKYEILIKYNNVDYIFNSTNCAFIMPKYCDYDANDNGTLDYNEDVNRNNILDEGEDINGNGKLDRVEAVFGAGIYTIKVRALTDDSEQYVHSNYCEEITITILDTPKDLAVQDGNIVWTNNTNAGYYIIKVYLFGKDAEGNITKELIVSTQSSVSEMDLTKLAPFETGVYGISVQAMHDASKVLASKESDVLEVIRLPQVAEYYIKDGELYFRIHKFYTKAEIYLTDKESGTITNKLATIENLKATETLENYVVENGVTTWAMSDVIDTYEDFENDENFVDVKYESENDSTLRQILAEDYRISVKLCGNSFASTDLSKLNIGGIISGYISQPSNRYLKNINAGDTNIIEKLVTPTTTVSETERGVVLVSIQNGLNYNLKYYMDGENSLQGVHLYKVNIATDKTYTLYVAEIVDNDKFTASLTAVGSSLIRDGEDKQYLKHFEYNRMTFNVIDKNSDGFVPFNFNTSYYYYYEPINEETKEAGGYRYIDLTKGGSFVVNVRFMGDDTIYTNSNVTENVTIKRYNVLNLSIKNGVMSWLNQATVDDHPIYLITLVGDNENYNLVLYNPDIEYEEGKKYTEEYLLNCLDSTKTYIFDTITYVVTAETIDEVITYKGLADIVDKIRIKNGGKGGLGGTFLATIKAHYTDISSTDTILAQQAEGKTITILPKAQIGVNNGSLTWNISYVTVTNSIGNNKEYIADYLLQIFNGSDKLYEITLSSELSSNMYNVSGETATYQLPQVINNGSDGDFTFTAGSNYTFNLIALGMDSSSYINSVSTTTGEINLLPQLEKVRMENGVLTWTNPTTNSVEIYISYKVGDAIITHTDIVSSNSFRLPTAFDDLNGTTRYFVEGNDYYIRARLKGQTTTLNGFYNDEFGGVVRDEYKIITTRLATIDSNSIVTIGVTPDGKLIGGVLTWEANQLDDVTYTVVYTLEDGTTYTTEMLDTNSFNFEGVASGKIKVKVFAHHNNHFTSFGSNTNERGVEVESKIVEVYKLTAVPTNSIKYNEGSNIISWDKVLGSDGNYIENYRVSIMQDGAETREYDCYKSSTTDSNEWIVTGVIGTSFSIAVKAISVESGGKTINSDYTGYCSMEIPNQVDVETFVFDEEEQAFKWKAIIGEQESDSYYIGYNYYETKPNEGENSTPTQIVETKVTYYKEIDGEKYYYYYPSAIGNYKSIYVQVKRAESLSSQPTYCDVGEDGLDFDLFMAGDGTSENPYIIVNETHLRNIKYFLNSKYELDNNFVLTSAESVTTATQIFTGAINGNNHYITGSANTSSRYFSESGYVGLFARVQGATFANITLTGFALSGCVNAQTTYIGILVGKAEGRSLADGSVIKSTFQNVSIVSSTIQIIKNTTEGYTAKDSNIYVGVIAGYADNVQFTECVVSLGGTGANITAILEGNMQTIMYIGAITGHAQNVKFSKNNTSNNDKAYALSTQLSKSEGSSIEPMVYAGALVGEVDSKTVTIKESNSCRADRIWTNSVEEIVQIGKEN